jgi:hypothetical protein
MKNLKEKNPPVLFLFLSGQMTPFPFFLYFFNSKGARPLPFQLFEKGGARAPLFYFFFSFTFLNFLFLLFF